ncbi:MAG: hypothetical protein LBH48_07065 [Bifidobacteriaceae bacterium]|nr:hypothetical protein [Bifidobacteriaceae bacterium]
MPAGLAGLAGLVAVVLAASCAAQPDSDVLPAGGVESSDVSDSSGADSGGENGTGSDTGGLSSGGQGSGEGLSAEDAALKFVECMREQGVEMDDPSPEGGIRLRVSPETEELVQAAQEICQPIMEQAAPDTARDSQRDEAQYEKLLAAAQCMRDKGYDYPDPEMDANGRISMKFRAGEGSAPDPQTMQRDQEECNSTAGLEDGPSIGVDDGGDAGGSTGTGGDGLSFGSVGD